MARSRSVVWAGGDSSMRGPDGGRRLRRPLLGLRRFRLFGGLDRSELTTGRLRAVGLVDPALDLLRLVGVLAQVRLGVVAPLPEPLLAVGEERARFLDDVVLEPEVDQAALGADPLAVFDVELGLAEGRGDLVLDHLDPDPVANRLGALLERLDPADVEPLGGIELERAAAGLRFRATKH